MQSLEFIEKAKSVKLIIFDVDGVFTDGRIYVNDQGVETKAFHVLDGQGIKLLQKAKIEIAVITGSHAPCVSHRMQYLGVRHIFQGCADKLPIYENLRHMFKLQDSYIACVGDDIPDLPLLQRAGLPITVSNAVQAVLDSTPFVTHAQGGQGAVREICDSLLKARL